MQRVRAYALERQQQLVLHDFTCTSTCQQSNRVGRRSSTRHKNAHSMLTNTWEANAGQSISAGCHEHNQREWAYSLVVRHTSTRESIQSARRVQQRLVQVAQSRSLRTRCALETTPRGCSTQRTLIVARAHWRIGVFPHSRTSPHCRARASMCTRHDAPVRICSV